MKKLILILVGLIALQAVPAQASTFDEDKLIAALKVLIYNKPCCGSCPRLDTTQARSILNYLRGNPDPAGEALWASVGDKVLGEIHKQDPAEAQRLRNHAKKLGEANKP